MRAEGAAADDIIAAYNHARTLPYVDRNRMILAGQSGGGMALLFAAGMREPEGLIAVLSFAAGRGGNPELSPGVPCAIELVGVRYWLPAVERFFAKHNIPFKRLDAADKRSESLLEAKLPNVKTESCTGLYRVFLEAPGPRAFAVSGDGRCGFAGGIHDAREVALTQCKRVAKGNDCSLYAVDEAVVWRDAPRDTELADAPRQASTGR